MASSTIKKSHNSVTVDFKWTPQGAGTYSQHGAIATGISKNRIRSVLVDSGGTNAGCFINTINNNGSVTLTIFQTSAIGSSEMTGHITIFYE